MALVFVDCEAQGPCPSMGKLTEFGAVEYVPASDPRRPCLEKKWPHVCSKGHTTAELLGPPVDPGPVGRTFHGLIYARAPGGSEHDPLAPRQVADPADVFREFDAWLEGLHLKGGVSFVSDNVAFDWQWICDGLWRHVGRCRFGHSGRRISDFYAGLTGDFRNTQEWKRLRRTKHDHHPVHDAIGNVEAFDRMIRGERA